MIEYPIFAKRTRKAIELMQRSLIAQQGDLEQLKSDMLMARRLITRLSVGLVGTSTAFLLYLISHFIRAL